MERYRIIQGIGVYFVTFVVVDWLPVFTDQFAFQILCDSLNFCVHHRQLRINAYVIMPNHFHAILFDVDHEADRLKRTLADLRKFTGRRLSDHCETHRPHCYREVLRKNAGADRLRRFWQPTIHAEAVVSERFWRQKVDYIHWNPVRKGLVREPAHWRFSSAAFWLEQSLTGDVILSLLEW